MDRYQQIMEMDDGPERDKALDDYFEEVSQMIINGDFGRQSISYELQQPPPHRSRTEEFIARMDERQAGLGRDFSEGWVERHMADEFPDAGLLPIYPTALVRDLHGGTCWYHGKEYEVRRNDDNCPWIEVDGTWYKVEEDRRYLSDDRHERDAFMEWRDDMIYPDEPEDPLEAWLDKDW